MECAASDFFLTGCGCAGLFFCSLLCYNTSKFGKRRDKTVEFKKQRVVVKVGTSTITHPSGAPNLRNIEILARTLSDLQDMGHEMI